MHWWEFDQERGSRRFENEIFFFHAADEEKGFKYDELIIQRSSENERHTLINLCLVAIWSDPFQIICKQVKHMMAMLLSSYLLLS